MPPIQRSGKANDLFMEELSRLMPKQAEKKDELEKLPEEKLADDRDDKGQEAEADKVTEGQLPEAGERKDEPKEETFEGQLEKSRKEKKAAAPNVDLEGVTEQRLNEASKDSFPHRNPKAHERTGPKRPVNALKEEMGNASDESKRERYEKAANAGTKEKRILDEDVGSQKTDKKASFNLKASKVAAIDACKEYIAYKDATEGKVKIASLDKLAEVKDLDACLSEIMEAAQKTGLPYSNDDLAKIAALKIRKSEILKVAAKGYSTKCKKCSKNYYVDDEEGDKGCPTCNVKVPVSDRNDQE